MPVMWDLIVGAAASSTGLASQADSLYQPGERRSPDARSVVGMGWKTDALVQAAT